MKQGWAGRSWAGLIGAGVVITLLWGEGIHPQAAEIAPATQRGPTDPAELEAFLDGIMATQMASEHIAGVTIAFIVDHRPFFAKGYGYADVQARKPVDPDQTMFRIGSVSKLLTWTAVLRLAEEGKLDLDADINQYLKEFKIPATYPAPITLKHLLSHTAGFEDQIIGLFARGADDLPPLGVVLARQLPARVRPPGQLASYSNHGTALAAYIVEQVTGQPWAEYVEETLLKPLGMRYTTVRQPPAAKLPPELSKGYAWVSGRFVEQGFEYIPAAPAGCASASAGDMVKFMLAHLQLGRWGDTRILREDTARQMHSLLFTHDPRLEGMAYGFMRTQYGDELIVEHGGDTFAFHSFFVMFPQRQSGFFVSYNTSTAGQARTTLLRAIMERYYRPAHPATNAPAVPAASDFAARAQRYTGSYGSLRHSHTSPAKLGLLLAVADVTVDQDDLVISLRGGEDVMRLREIEPGLFREINGYRRVTFRAEADRPATHLFLAGAPLAWARLPWYETQAFSLGLVVVCVLVVFSAVIGWPCAALLRSRVHTPPPTAGSRFAWILAWCLGVAILVALALSQMVFGQPDEIVFGMPPLLSGLLWAWTVIALLGAAVFGYAWVAWVRGYWRLAGRLHYTIVSLAVLALVWFLHHWNLLRV